MPRDTDRPDPSLSTPLGPAIRPTAPPAPAPTPARQPQPSVMDVADLGMILRDGAKPKPVPLTVAELHAQQAADWKAAQDFAAFVSALLDRMMDDPDINAEYQASMRGWNPHERRGGME